MSTNEIILVELDQQTLLDNKNEVEKWFEHVLTVQYSLESMVTKAVPKIKEPHIKEALEKILEANKHHSKSIDDLFDVIERTPDCIKDKVFGYTISILEESLLRLQDVLGGGIGTWQDLHLALTLNQQAMGAFAVAEQLGLTLGIKEIVNIAFPIVHEKTMHQLLLQEYMLEMAPIAILYKENV